MAVSRTCGALLATVFVVRTFFLGPILGLSLFANSHIMDSRAIYRDRILAPLELTVVPYSYCSYIGSYSIPQIHRNMKLAIFPSGPCAGQDSYTWTCANLGVFPDWGPCGQVSLSWRAFLCGEYLHSP